MVEALWRLQKIILDTLDFTQVVQRIVDSLALELGYLQRGYRIVVLALADEEQKVLKRVSMSQTPAAEAAMGAGVMSFDQIVIPFEHRENYCIQTYLDQQVRATDDWKDILTPPMTADQARHLQQICRIKNSLIYPVAIKGKSIGILIFSFSLEKDAQSLSQEERDILRGFAEVVALAIHDARLYEQLAETTRNLDAANKRLEKLDKLKDEFVSLASHELRTPMTAIKSYTWMVLNNKAGDVTPKSREYLDVVYQSTERLIRLVNEMLDISRIESGRIQMKIESFDLVKLLMELKEEFAARVAEKQLTLETVCTEKEISMTGDRGKVLQIVENLVGNATKFTPAGGHIKVTATETDQGATIAIADTGRGIKPEDLGKLFQKFGRLEQGSLTSIAESGTGLGLYLAKQYAQLHGGTITVASEVGKGTTFTVTLPLSFTSLPTKSTLENT